jgi:hypothetical protein
MGRTRVRIHFSEAMHMCTNRYSYSDGRTDLRPARLRLGSVDWTCVVIWSELVRRICMDMFDVVYPASEHFDTIVRRIEAIDGGRLSESAGLDPNIVRSMLMNTQHDPVPTEDGEGENPMDPIERLPSDYSVVRKDTSGDRRAFS